VFLLVFIFLTRLNRGLLGVSEVGVLVHNVVEVGDLPVEGRLVVGRDDVNQVAPSQVSFKPHYILHSVLVSASEEHLGVVLILDVHFHGGLNESSDCH